MSNSFSNRIDITMTPAQITGVKTGLQAAETNMPFTIGLTVDERITLPKINVSNKAFTEDAINAFSNNASMLPGYLDVNKMKTDLTLFTQLDELEGVAMRVLEKIQDTKMLAGSEAYVSALAVYRLFGAAAEAGVPGADTIHDQLKERFTNNGGSTPTPVDPTE